jgi:ABC-type polysaccharide transport system permease subunit
MPLSERQRAARVMMIVFLIMMVLFHLPPIPFEEVVAFVTFEYEEYVMDSGCAFEVA